MQNLSDRALKERIIGAVVLVIVAVLIVPIFLDGQSGSEEIVSTAVRLPGQANENQEQQTIVLTRDRSEPVPSSQQRSPVAGTSVSEPSSQQRSPVASTSVSEPSSQQRSPVASTSASEPSSQQRAPVANTTTREPVETDHSSAEASPAVVESAAEEAPTATAGVSAADVAAAPAEESATGMWAVQLGSFSSQENADKLAADLRSQGYAAFLSQLTRSGAALHRVRVGPQKDRDSAEEIARQLGKGGHKGQVVPHP